MRNLILLVVIMTFLASIALAESPKVVEEKTKTAVDEKAKEVTVKKAEAVDEAKKAEAEAKSMKEEMVPAKAPEIITTESGLRYQDLKVGEGKTAEMNMKVDCHYTLWLADSTGLVKGKQVDSSHDPKRTSFQCTLGQRLIPGWSEGMVGMKEGGIRRVFVPWKLGYGEMGSGRTIPGKTDLIFDIEFIKAM